VRGEKRREVERISSGIEAFSKARTTSSSVSDWARIVNSFSSMNGEWRCDHHGAGSGDLDPGKIAVDVELVEEAADEREAPGLTAERARAVR
jgi:hypothetical protein